MTKAELIDAVAKSAEVSKVDAERSSASFFDHVTKATKKGDKVAWPGFGSFSTTKRAARSRPQPADRREGQDRRLDGDEVHAQRHAEDRAEPTSKEVTMATGRRSRHHQGDGEEGTRPRRPGQDGHRARRRRPRRPPRPRRRPAKKAPARRAVAKKAPARGRWRRRPRQRRRCQEGSGQEGRGQEGSGQEGSGQEGSGQEGPGEEGAGEEAPPRPRRRRPRRLRPRRRRSTAPLSAGDRRRPPARAQSSFASSGSGRRHADGKIAAWMCCVTIWSPSTPTWTGSSPTATGSAPRRRPLAGASGTRSATCGSSTSGRCWR